MSYPRKKLEVLIAEASPGFASGERDPKGVVQLRMNNVGRNGEFVWDSFLRVPSDEETTEYYALRSGDILFNNTNSTELVGKTALFTGHTETVVFSNHFTRIRTKPDLLEPGYLSRWLNLQWRKKVFEDLCNRWVGQSAIKLDALLPLEIPLPPLTKQREIVARLEAQLAAAARARAAVAAQLTDAEKLARATVDQEFFAHIWGLAPLRNFSLISGGIQKTPDRAPQSFNRPFLTVRNVQRGSLDLSAVERFELTTRELERYKLEAGDLLIVEGNGSRDHIGRNAIFPVGMKEEWIHQNHIIRVRFDGTNVDPRFASIYFNSQPGRDQMIERAATTTGLFTLSTSKVGSLELPILPLAEQRRIIARIEKSLAQADALTASAKARLADLDRLPAALLREAFDF